MSVEHGSRKQWQKAAKSVTAQKQVSQSQLERYSQRYSLESQRNFSRIPVQSGRYHMFKVAEHSSLAVCEYMLFAKSWQEKGCSSQAETWQVKNILMKDFD